MASEYICGLQIGRLRSRLKLQGEYSIGPTANPIRDSIGRLQVSIFVDCSTELSQLIEVADRMLDVANGKSFQIQCPAQANQQIYGLLI